MYNFFRPLFSLFARAKMLYRRLVDDVIEIFVLLHTSYFSYVVPKRVQIACICILTTVNICKGFLTTGLDHFLNCAVLN